MLDIKAIAIGVTFLQFMAAILAIGVLVSAVKFNFQNGKRLTAAGWWLLAVHVSIIAIIALALYRDMTVDMPEELTTINLPVYIARAAFALTLLGFDWCLMGKTKLIEKRDHDANAQKP